MVPKILKDAFKIAVTSPGHVVPEDEVPSYWDKQNVFPIVACVPSVKDSLNRLIVQTPVIPIEIIKVETGEYLIRMRTIKDPAKIMLELQDEVLVLRGAVNFPQGEALVEEIGSWPRDVRPIGNQVEVSYAGKTVSDSVLVRAIKNMLSCDFPLAEKTL